MYFSPFFNHFYIIMLLKSLPFGGNFALLAKSYYGALAKKLEHLELTRYYSILLYIEAAGEQRCTQQHICDHLKIDKVSMVRMIKYLLVNGYVVKSLNTKNRREHILELSSKSMEILPQIHRAIEEIDAVAFKGMTEKQKNFFVSSLHQLEENLNKLPVEKITIHYKKK